MGKDGKATAGSTSGVGQLQATPGISAKPAQTPIPIVATNVGFEELDGAQIGHGEDTVVLSIRVLGAKNIRGAKGEHVNSFVRVQFADFDYKDSPVLADTSSPEFNFTIEQNLHVDEVKY
ncbi:hypothetical protein HDU96_010110 [Phlyctochytrium bullatum]|nr:hypothetical protein HDU96_010110 [Phlyctochytrium bullatum]